MNAKNFTGRSLKTRLFALLMAAMLSVTSCPVTVFASAPADGSVTVTDAAEPEETEPGAPATELALDKAEEEKPSGTDSGSVSTPASTENAASDDDDVGSLTTAAEDGSDSNGSEDEDDFDPNADADSGEGDAGQQEDVVETPNEDSEYEPFDNSDAASAESDSENGVTVSYKADSTTAFDSGKLKAGQIFVDKSVGKSSATDTAFSEVLSIYGKEFVSTSEYSTGNYVLVVDCTRSLYLADTSGQLVKAVTTATNNLVKEICKNPLSNVAVIGFSADNLERTANKNPDPTSLLLGMGNWGKVSGDLLQCDTSSSNECAWYIGASSAAAGSNVAKTGKRYISYGTFPQAGIAHAASILEAQKDKADTAGYIIFLTDGVPTYGTTKWAAAYDPSSDAWHSKTSYALGNGGYSTPDATAYALMTMQYWSNKLSSEYQKFALYSAHFSNDGYNSGDEDMARWMCGVVNNVTYQAGTGTAKNDKGFIFRRTGQPEGRHQC